MGGYRGITMLVAVLVVSLKEVRREVQPKTDILLAG
jgi:hypothetical protein